MARQPLMRFSGSYPFQSYEPPHVDMRVLSLGAGVQSSRILLGILEGEYDPAPDLAIFADTGWEPKRVYEHLNFLMGEAAKADFPIHIVSKGNIREDAMRSPTSRGGKSDNGRFASMPLYTRNKDGEHMKMRRQCTREYKIEPIERKVRELLGLKPGERSKFVVESWQGISTDEQVRMKENRTKWIWNRYPLIESGESRAGCLKWLAANGFPEPPKSSCIGCPYHDNSYWRWLKTHSPDEWQDAVEFDRFAQSGIMRWDRPAYLHSSLVPLDEVDLTDPNEGQHSFGFAEECDGICGV